MRNVAIVGTSLAGLRAAETFGARASTGASSPSVRAAPPVRPAPAVERAAAGDWEPTSCVARQGVDDSISLAPRRARGRAASRRARGRAADGERVAFDGLVIATGANHGGCRISRICGRVHLRTSTTPWVARAARQPSESRRDRRRVHRREIAATCRTRGLDVTVARSAAPTMVRGSGRSWVRARRDPPGDGVDLRTDVS